MNAIERAGIAVRNARLSANLSQRELARRARTAQSVVARIEGGQTNPTIETLMHLVAATGFALEIGLVPRAVADPVIQAYKRDIDRSLLRENLTKSIDDRVNSLQALARLAREALMAGATARLAP